MFIMRLFLVVCVVIGCGGFLFAGTPLSEFELKHLKSSELNQSICYTTYTQSDQGAASVLGYYFDAFLSEKYFIGLGIFGAVGGNRGGYGIASIGGGARKKIGKVRVDGRLYLGSGGGGGVPAGGGFSVFPEVGAYYPLPNVSALGFLRTGYLWFPGGDFNSPTVSLGVTYFYKVPYLSMENK